MNAKQLAALRGLVQAGIARVNVQAAARVVTYDRAEQRATVTLDVLSTRVDRSGARTYAPRVTVPNVPVAWPNGPGGSLTFDLAEGSRGMLVFADRSLDEWLSSGRQDLEPTDPRRHDYTDGVFYPSARPFSDALAASAYAADAAVLAGADVRLGASTATKAVALDPDVQAAMVTLEAALQTAASAAVSGGAPGDGGTAAFTAFAASLTSTLAAWPPSMGATKVKAE